MPTRGGDTSVKVASASIPYDYPEPWNIDTNDCPPSSEEVEPFPWPYSIRFL